MSTQTETERLVNAGVSIKLKKFGDEDIRVRELALEDIVVLTSDLALVLEVFGGDKLKSAVSGKGKATEGIEVLAAILQAEPTLNALRKVAAAATDKKPEDFVRMGMTDWAKLIKALNEVSDWEELIEVFFALFPTLGNSLKDYLPTAKAAETNNQKK